MTSTIGGAGRVRYDKAFQLEALRRWKTSRRSASAVAKEMGMSPATLYAWGRESRGNGNGESVATASKLLRELENEITRLREENAKLRQHREILKKTLAILSEPQRAAAVAGLLEAHAHRMIQVNSETAGNPA
jgi:transposase